MSPVSSLGGEIYEYQTIKGFTKKGIKVLAYLPKNRPYDKSLKNLKVLYAPLTHIVPPWIYSFICLPILFRTYQKEKFDILKIQTPRFLGLAAIIFHIFYPDVPIVCSGVTVDKTRFLYWIEKMGYQIAAAIIVQSEYMKSFIVKNYKINENKIFVTYGGILDNFTRTVGSPKEVQLINKNDKVLVFMGVLTKRKNPIFLIKVIRDLVKKDKKIKLVIIGSGGEKSRLLSEVTILDLDKNIIFIDSAYGENKNFWFKRMDIFLLPSYDEGFGLAVTEAMSFGKVVITTKYAAFPEIVNNGISGFTLDLKKKKWVDVIYKVLKNPGLKKRIGRRSRVEVYRKFNWSKMYDLNEKVVEGLLR